jgi:hypothetical protein
MAIMPAVDASRRPVTFSPFCYHSLAAMTGNAATNPAVTSASKTARAGGVRGGALLCPGQLPGQSKTYQ